MRVFSSCKAAEVDEGMKDEGWRRARERCLAGDERKEEVWRRVRDRKSGGLHGV